jgi:hypothetical protein
MLGDLQSTTGMIPLTREDMINAGMPDPCQDTSDDPNMAQWRANNCPQGLPTSMYVVGAVAAIGIVILIMTSKDRRY